MIPFACEGQVVYISYKTPDIFVVNPGKWLWMENVKLLHTNKYLLNRQIITLNLIIKHTWMADVQNVTKNISYIYNAHLNLLYLFIFLSSVVLLQIFNFISKSCLDI